MLKGGHSPVKMEDVIDEIKLELTGDVLELEVEDATLVRAVEKSMRELERYWDETTMITVPFSDCIDVAGSDLDLKEKVSSIVKIYRTDGYGESSSDSYSSVLSDPMYAQQWMIFSNVGSTYSLSDYIMNYAAYSQLCQIQNTMSTDLSFEDDRHNNKLYINIGKQSRPKFITIKYIPKINSIEDIKSDYWIDILIRMSIDNVKIYLGRIRTRFTQSNALWAQDGDKLLEEGISDLKELREVLRNNANLAYPID